MAGYYGGQGPPPYSSVYQTGSNIPPPETPGFGRYPQQSGSFTGAPLPPAPVGAERPPREQCFLVENPATRFVLEIEGASVDPNARVVTSRENGSDSQLWYEEAYTGTIRSRLNMMCLHINEYNCAVVRPYTPGDMNQQWQRSASRIQNRQDPMKVLMVSSNRVGSNIMSTIESGDPRHQWSFPCPDTVLPPTRSATGSLLASQRERRRDVFGNRHRDYDDFDDEPIGGLRFGVTVQSRPMRDPPRSSIMSQVKSSFSQNLAQNIRRQAAPPPPPMTREPPRRYFYIRSEMHGLVIDVEAGDRSPGTRAIMWPRKGVIEDNQLWYEDPHGVIHSKLTGFAFQNTGAGITLQLYSNQPGQMWRRTGNRICLAHSPNTCLDITGEDRGNGAGICQYQYKGSSNQHWAFDYV